MPAVKNVSGDALECPLLSAGSIQMNGSCHLPAPKTNRHAAGGITGKVL